MSCARAAGGRNGESDVGSPPSRPGGRVGLASEARSFVIAEGIETQAALESVEGILLRHHLSAGYGAQGFLLGRPAEGFEVTGAGVPVASAAACGYR